MSNIYKSSELSGNYETVAERKISFPAYYEDTDFTGVVYHASYIKLFQRAREEMLGLNYLIKLFERGIMFAVTHIDIQFLKPARYADTIAITSILSFKRNVACLFKQRAIKEDDGKNGIVFATATTKIVPVDPQGNPIHIPGDVLHQIKENALTKK